MPIDFITPLGRIVQGSPLKFYDKDKKTGLPLTIKSGPDAGKPTKAYVIAVAFPKVYPADHPQAGQPNAEWAELYGKLYAEGKAAWPLLFNGQGGACTHPRFTLKVSDGDGVDNNGVQNNTKPGWAGHWVLRLKSSFPPQCVTDKGVPITDENVIKTGYYVQVLGSAKTNGSSDTPGLYVNLSGCILKFIGPVISSGPDLAAAVAQIAAQGGGYVPTGATAVPLQLTAASPALAGVAHAPAALAAPLPGLPAVGGAAPLPAPGGMPPLPGAGVAMAVAGPLPGMPGGAPALPVAGGAPPLPGLQPTAAAPVATTLPPVYAPGPQMPPGMTRESLNAQGYSDEQLLQAQYIVKQAPPANPAILGVPATGAALPGLPALAAAQPAAPVYGPGPAMPPGMTHASLTQQGYSNEQLLQAQYIVRIA